MEWIVKTFATCAAFVLGLLPAHTILYSAPTWPFMGHEAVIIFGGDMMFDRSIRATTDEKGSDFIFSCIDDVLEKSDLVVANLEGPITPNPSKSAGSIPGGEGNFTFTFPPSTAQLLFEHRIRLVNVGNNHIMNFGQEGLAATKQFLDDAGVRYFGESDASETDRVARVEIEGIPFSFVNWSDWTSDNIDHTVDQIKTDAESGRVVVVYTHWGDEYAPPPKRVRGLAHRFVDAGARIVIGSHPHIVQEHEAYRGVLIYYSLGNFIFDQYWNEDVRRGLLLQVTFDKKGVKAVEEIPVHLERDRRTCPQAVE
ncbi:CapA family protein [Candidatus Kaiserbacteria bacterium]|nr:CapA family protein [Candidatus Kaiserbacteria bacterium]